MSHQYLEDAGQVPHSLIDQRLPTAKEKGKLATIGKSAPVSVGGSRGGNAALANLLAALESLELINDNTSA